MNKFNASDVELLRTVLTNQMAASDGCLKHFLEVVTDEDESVQLKVRCIRGNKDHEVTETDIVLLPEDLLEYECGPVARIRVPGTDGLYGIAYLMHSVDASLIKTISNDAAIFIIADETIVDIADKVSADDEDIDDTMINRLQELFTNSRSFYLPFDPKVVVGTVYRMSNGDSKVYYAVTAVEYETKAYSFIGLNTDDDRPTYRRGLIPKNWIPVGEIKTYGVL